MADIPDIIDDDLTISVANGGGFAALPFEISDNGVVSDLSGVALFFEVADITIRKPCAPDPANARGRMFPRLTTTECNAIPDGGAIWRMWDETDPDARIMIMTGRIRRF